MRPQPFLFAGLALLLAAEAHAQSSLYGPEMSRVRLALAAFVALLLFLLIRRGAPVRGTRHWFWEASEEEIGPELARIRKAAAPFIAFGACSLVGAVLTGGAAVGMAVVDAYGDDGSYGNWVAHLRGGEVFFAGVFAVLGAALLLWGLRMVPKDLPRR